MAIYRNESTEKTKAFWKTVDKAAARASGVPQCRIQEIGDEWLDSPNDISSFLLTDSDEQNGDETSR